MFVPLLTAAFGAPPVVELSLPETVYPYEAVLCDGLAVDPDGPEEPTVEVRWLHGDEVHDGARLPEGVLAAGQTWTCEVTVTDVDGEITVATHDVWLDVPATNVLVIVMDDVGIDHMGSYGVAPSTPETPVMDQLAAEGISFDHAYAYSSCAPTRAALLTGRIGVRTGLSYNVGPLAPVELPLAEITLPEMLALGTVPYDSSAIGKWHVGWGVTGPSHPLDQGFGWFAGARGNLDAVVGDDYYDWLKFEGGVGVQTTTYATTDTTDDAVERLAVMEEPWLAWVAYNAPHEPFHEPPPDLVNTPLPANPTPAELYDAMLEALDTEIGRLLDSLPDDVRERTTVVLLGDNGTPKSGVTAPFQPSRAKRTPFDGGIHVPLVVTGPLVGTPGSRSEALVSVMDLFPTVAAQAGVDLQDLVAPGADGVDRVVPLDGRSLLRALAEPDAPVHDTLYLEHVMAQAGGVVAHVRIAMDRRYKLLWDGSQMGLFDRATDPYDEGRRHRSPPVPEAVPVFDRLQGVILEAEATLAYEHPP